MHSCKWNLNVIESQTMSGKKKSDHFSYQYLNLIFFGNASEIIVCTLLKIQWMSLMVEHVRVT